MTLACLASCSVPAQLARDGWVRFGNNFSSGLLLKIVFKMSQINKKNIAFLLSPMARRPDHGSSRTASAHQAVAGGLQAASLQPSHPVAVASARMGCARYRLCRGCDHSVGTVLRQFGSANEDGGQAVTCRYRWPKGRRRQPCSRLEFLSGPSIARPTARCLSWRFFLSYIFKK